MRFIEGLLRRKRPSDTDTRAVKVSPIEPWPPPPPRESKLHYGMVALEAAVDFLSEGVDRLEFLRKIASSEIDARFKVDGFRRIGEIKFFELTKEYFSGPGAMEKWNELQANHRKAFRAVARYEK